MRIFGQAEVDGVRRNANGRKYMMQGVYTAGITFGDKCSFPSKCVFMGSIFGDDCHFGKNCFFAHCLIGEGGVIGEGSYLYFTVIGYQTIIKKYITTKCEQMDMWEKAENEEQNTGRRKT